jgi:hypothetical protein
MKSMAERRTDVRLLCADMVEVRWRTGAGRQCHATALLEDISRSGACLQFETPVPAGVELTIECPGQELTGTVRYCVYREIGHFVGLEFTNRSAWSVEAFKPCHLLDLQKLARGAQHGS